MELTADDGERDARPYPWAAAQRESLGSDGCWVGSPPAEEEPQVADDLKWTTQPEDNKAESGRHVLHATSSTWCSPPAGSNELTVAVKE
jgi:hypothetical protein